MEVSIDEGAVRQRAYAIWEAEGRPDGREWDHWVRASEEVRDSGSVKPRRASRARKAPAGGRIRAALKSVMSA